nr:uncharacterized protein LOC105843865 [Hydra vulgaris]
MIQIVNLVMAGLLLAHSLDGFAGGMVDNFRKKDDIYQNNKLIEWKRYANLQSNRNKPNVQNNIRFPREHFKDCAKYCDNNDNNCISDCKRIAWLVI